MKNSKFSLIVACVAAWCVMVATVRCASAAPNFSVRVKVVSVAGKAPTAGQSFKMAVNNAPEAIEWKGVEWSGNVTSGQYNGEPLYLPWATITPTAAGPFPRLKLQVEAAIEGGEKTATEADLFGPLLGLMIWKQGDQTHIGTRADHFRMVYGPHFKAAEIPKNDRPKKILLGDRFVPASWQDNNALVWEAGLGGLAGLGMNTIMYDASPVVTETARATGMTRTWGAVYNPPGYAFNFDLNRQEVFKDFVQKQIGPALDAGWKKEEIGYWVTSDEPGWYYPAQYNAFNNDPNALAAFHAYLKENNQTLETLGKKSWDEVRLIGRKEYFDLPTRRLFYWSNRFAPLASSRFFGEVTKVYENAIRPGVPIMVNFNNFMGLFYNPGPVANNGDGGNPNAAMGQHDWLEFGRERGSTSIATEDWFGDWAASYWSFYAARLRSAAELSGDPKVGFGALVIPRESGQTPGGMRRKIMSLVGNGAKTLQFFTFGPEYTFPGNCWSENTPVYKEISAGAQMVGKAEDLLFPGKTRRPQVALLTPQSSQLWDLEDQEIASGLYEATNTHMHAQRMEYASEMFSVYYTLQRAAIPANFVDEKGLTEDSLKNYKVLYVTAPDIPRESVIGLLKWVREGGTLVTLPGAGQFDRYHQSIDGINEASGVKPTKAVREISRRWGASDPSGSITRDGEKMTVYGTREPMEVTDAKVVLKFDDGEPALTEKTVGTGRIVHFAFLPGLAYYREQGVPNADLTVAGKGMRELVANPVHAAKVAQPVTLSVPVIEAPTLYSDKGVAVTLLNWGNQVYDKGLKVTVTVAVDKPVKRAESVRHGKTEFKQTGLKVTATLPVSDADVLKLYY